MAGVGQVDGLKASGLALLIPDLQRAIGQPEALPDAPVFETSGSYGDDSSLHQLWQEFGLGKALRSSRRQFDAKALIIPI